MSLLDRNAPHTVLVQKRVLNRDEGGRAVFVNDGEPVAHRCMVQVARDWSSAEESMDAGLQVYDMRVIYSREWSGDANSHILISEPSGPALFEMIGAPQWTSASPRTTHWRVTCRRIGAAA